MRIEGDVKDGDGKAIFGATVSTAGKFSSNSDRNGHFVLKGLSRSPGTYVVKVSKQQYTFQPGHAMVPSQQKGDVTGVRFTGTNTATKK